MSDTSTAQTAAEWYSLANNIGLGGLGFLVFALMKGLLITRREYDVMANRAARLEEKLDHALEILRTGVATSAQSVAVAAKLSQQSGKE